MKANKRMFTREILEADNFMELKPITKVLYFYLCLNADNDGLVNNVKLVMRMTGARKKDLELLTEKGFVFCFPSGVIAIVHWWAHNNKDTVNHKGTSHVDEYEMLCYNALTREYELKMPLDINAYSPT